MRSPHSPHGEPIRRVRESCFLVSLVALGLEVLASPSWSRTATVDMGGGAEFTSIQSAIDSMFITRVPGGTPDTVLVGPGYYDESIVTHDDGNVILRVICPAGPESTRVRSVVFPPYSHFSSHPAEIEGLGVVETAVTGTHPATYWFRNCRFEGGYVMPPFASMLTGYILRDCWFFRRSVLTAPPTWGDTEATLMRLHFVGVTLHLNGNDSGDGTISDCTFEGPADTLVVAQPITDGTLRLIRCSFQGGGMGIVKGPLGGNNPSDWIDLDRCVFTGQSESAIASSDAGDENRRVPGVRVRDSRFGRCNRAVDWGGGQGYVRLERDTLQTLNTPAIRVTSHWIELNQVVFQPGSGGVLAKMEYASWNPPGWPAYPRAFEMRGCGMSQVAGTAVSVDDTIPASECKVTVQESRIAVASGAGIRIAAADIRVSGNVVSGCGGAGIELNPTTSNPTVVADSNTVVGNAGDGIRIVGPWTYAPRVIQHNLAARNDGAGIRVGTPLIGSVAFNDAWQNYLGDYAQVGSPLDSNLVVDPQFCDLIAGDLGLQLGSPCGAGGVYGLIGALPEACASTVGAPTASPLAFSLHPNPARGSVAFTPPAAGADGTIEVLDVQGRRVWSAPFRAGAPPIVWRGESSRGALDAGLYWARMTRPGETSTRRLVWLE